MTLTQTFDIDEELATVCGAFPAICSITRSVPLNTHSVIDSDFDEVLDHIFWKIVPQSS